MKKKLLCLMLVLSLGLAACGQAATTTTAGETEGGLRLQQLPKHQRRPKKQLKLQQKLQLRVKNVY